MRLPTITIREPCAEDWGAMDGDERSRFCGRCQQSVVNLSALSVAEAADTLEHRTAGQKLCVRFERDHEGAVVTRTTRQQRIVDLLRALGAKKAGEGP